MVQRTGGAKQTDVAEKIYIYNGDNRLSRIYVCGRWRYEMNTIRTHKVNPGSETRALYMYMRMGEMWQTRFGLH